MRYVHEVSQPIGVGIVGLSVSAHWAANAHLPALRVLPEFDLVALSTTRRESADEAAKKHGVPLAFDDAARMAEHPDVDVVVVAVKVPDHRELVEQVLAAGKHVYCEWPLGANTAEARGLLAAAENAGVVHMVGLQAHAHPAITRAAELVRDGAVGRVLSASLIGTSSAVGGEQVPGVIAWGVDSANGMNLLTVPASHSIDPFLHIVGELEDVSASVATGTPRPVVAETGEQLVATAPDQVVAHGRLARGGLASIHFQGGTPGRNGAEIRVYGTEATLVVRGEGVGMQRAPLELFLARRDEPLERLELEQDHNLPEGPGENVGRLYRRLAQAIRDGSSVQPDFAHAVRRHTLLDRLSESSETGRRQGVPQ